MKNTNYAPEIATAYQFALQHNNDIDFMNMLHEVSNCKYIHSDRWSIIYDWMMEHYPEATGTIITGLSYWVEE